MINNNKGRQEALSHLDTVEDALKLTKDAFDAIGADSLVVAIKKPGLASAQVNGNDPALSIAVACSMATSARLRTVIMDAMSLFAELMTNHEKTLGIEVLKEDHNENNHD